MIKLKMNNVTFKFNTFHCSRGIRNNNPANIRHSCSKWLGLSKVQVDKEFCTFDSMEFGVRALLVLLRTYYNKHHCNTIRKVISRFAPSSENNTEKYIKYVCDFMVYPPDDFRMSPDTCMSLSTCLILALPIMRFESGYRMTFKELHTIIDKYNLC